MLCTVIKGPTLEQARKQLAQAKENCSLVELRLDYFEKINLKDIKALREEFSISMIFTLRCTSQGGNYTGSENNRKEQIRNIIQLNPEYIDLEYNLPTDFVKELKANYPNTKIIVSYHDFEKMPPPELVLKEMQRNDADIYKMAFMLHSSSEALDLLLFMKHHSKNVLAMGMGPYGESTRILGPLYGARFVYGNIDQESSTAPGQIPVKVLSDVYNFKNLNPNTAIYGLIGDPVYKSLSHFSHNAVFVEQNLKSVYVKFPVSQNQLADFIPLAKKADFKGLSVTMPLKEAVVPFIDEIDPWAKKIGSVNTLKFENGKIKGYNTDGVGALDAIEAKVKVKGLKIVFIGAGGAAKAVIAEAIDRGALVTILNRDESKAITLAEKMGCKGGSLEHIEDAFNTGYDIIINATPSPMPIDAKWIIQGSIVMDLKTQPQNTQFLYEAKKKGCTLVYGYEMFINQAVEQLKIWFGESVNLKKSKKIIEDSVLKNIQKD